jgi:hypothetical protein
MYGMGVTVTFHLYFMYGMGSLSMRKEHKYKLSEYIMLRICDRESKKCIQNFQERLFESSRESDEKLILKWILWIVRVGSKLNWLRVMLNDNRFLLLLLNFRFLLPASWLNKQGNVTIYILFILVVLKLCALSGNNKYICHWTVF